MRSGAAAVAAVVFLTIGMGSARALEASELLPDPALESRARTISAELRCLVCQNQSIDDSDAPLARDLRGLVRERLKAGDSDAQVKEAVVSRYGEFALLRPAFAGHTLLLWLAPAAILLLAAGGVVVVARRRAVPASAGDRLTLDERARLDDVLGRPG